jgi:DNA polymerase III delta prime subunit
MHHALLLIGTREWALTQIPETERTEGSDVSIRSYEKFTIKDARELNYEANMRPVEKTHRTFTIICNIILLEAQNALLKLFEEPNNHTRFYLIIPREDILLPTLKSRLHTLATETVIASMSEFTKFLAAPYAERLSLIAEKLTKEDFVWVDTLIQNIVLHAHTSRSASLMRDTLLLESYIRTNGSSKKMLLEHIALSL